MRQGRWRREWSAVGSARSPSEVIANHSDGIAVPLARRMFVIVEAGDSFNSATNKTGQRFFGNRQPPASPRRWPSWGSPLGSKSERPLFFFRLDALIASDRATQTNLRTSTQNFLDDAMPEIKETHFFM